MGVNRSQPLKRLASSRPPLAKSTRSMSRKACRALINSHHKLEKKRRQAALKGDNEAEAAIVNELNAHGGLKEYQLASLQGQRLERGGDTSQVLLEWLPTQAMKASGQRYKMLEVGSLSTCNACSTSGLFDMVHIDLNSQEPGILQQDFMERPLPEKEADKFDVISLSLVLNFVADAAGRGRMLFRSQLFLRNNSVAGLPFPSLFLVLPRSCLTNSRYFAETRLTELMKALGYELVKAKLTQKLAYSLWKSSGEMPSSDINITKQEVHPGRMRNNFVVTLHLSTDKSVCQGTSHTILG